MKALSFKQPWLKLMVDGIKDIENRNWSTQYRGPLLLHTSKNFDLQAVANTDLPWPSDMSWQATDYEQGGFVAIATLHSIVTKSESPWFFGRFGWHLIDIQPVKFYPYPGRLMLFDVPDETVRAVLGDSYATATAERDIQQKLQLDFT